MRHSWTGGSKRAFSLGVRRADIVRGEADDELASLIEERIDLLVEQGMSPEAARDEAMRRLGESAEQARTHLRQSAERRERAMSIREWMSDVLADTGYAIRGFRREPLFAGFVVVTLALAIGVNAAMFGVADKVLLRGPAGVADPNRLVRLYWVVRGAAGEDRTSAAFDPRVYANLEVEATAFSGLAMYNPAFTSTVVGSGPTARAVAGATATANFMSVLGARPILGRFFSIDEQTNTTPPRVAVLGYGFWKSEFGGERSVIGRSITVDGRPTTIVGVAPEGFTGVELERVDVWTPLPTKSGPAARQWGPGSSRGPSIVARLRAGVTLDAATADATIAYQRSYTAGEKDYAEARIFAGALTNGNDGSESAETRVSRWLVGLSAIVLLVACTNIINLLLARGVRRRREMAVRLALGAGRARLFRLLLTSSITIAVIGSVAGLAVAFVAGQFVRYTLLPDVDWTTGPVDVRVLAYTTIATLLTGIVIGVLPAISASRTDVTASLKSGAREGGGNRSIVRSALILAQATLAMILLVGAGLFVRSLDRVRHLDLGIQPDRVVAISPRWPRIAETLSDSARQTELARRAAFVTDIVGRVRALPGVENAAITVGRPFGMTMAVSVFLPGRDSLPRLKGGFGNPEVSAVSREYFATMGTRLIRGRVFAAEDRANRVAVVSEMMARTLWPGRDPIGECLLIGKREVPCTRVIGVAQDVRRSRIREDPLMHYYVPVGQEPTLTGSELLVRPRGDAGSAVRMLREALFTIDPSMRYVDAEVLQHRVEPQTRAWRIGAMMFTLFAVLALVVAAVGTFSVVAYLVEQRHHEIGVRVALGAQASQVVALMVRAPVALCAGGAVAGAALAFALGRLAEALLFDTSPTDPTVIGGVAVVLVLVSTAASVIPALRVRQVDPMEALRDD